MITLHARGADSETLEAALKNCVEILKNPPAIALLYSPRECLFAKLDRNGELLGYDGKAIDLNPVFEARVFNNKAELRWLNKAGGKGRAVLISEDDISSYLETTLEPVKASEPLNQTYLLLGEGSNHTANDGWSVLTAARIGALPVPHPGVAEHQRVLLKTREYVAETEWYGNVAVAEERLLELETAK